jgi:hypothetical protein
MNKFIILRQYVNAKLNNIYSEILLKILHFLRGIDRLPMVNKDTYTVMNTGGCIW